MMPEYNANYVAGIVVYTRFLSYNRPDVSAWLPAALLLVKY